MTPRITQVFSTLATFALTTIAQQSTSSNGIVFPSTFEMDFLFPQNETYKTAEVFPIVMAVQDVSALYTAISTMEQAQNLTAGQLRPQLSWHLDAYRDDGKIPGYVALVKGFMNLTDAMVSQPADKGDYAIFTAITNMTEVLAMSNGGVSRADFRYAVTYYVQVFDDSPFDHPGRGFCPKDNEYGEDWGNAGVGRVIFNIDRPELEYYLPEEELAEAKKAKEVDVMKSIPECPVYVTLVDILPNITTSETGKLDGECPVYFDGREDFPQTKKDRGNPCALKVDKPILSAISSEVARLAAPPTTTDEVVTSTSAGAAGFATGFVHPMQTALAAACVLCGLAL